VLICFDALACRFSLPGVYHIVFLMVVVFFVFAIAAMALFGSVKHGNYIDVYGNFETFPVAALTLFRSAQPFACLLLDKLLLTTCCACRRAMTGEDWNGLMRDCMIEVCTHHQSAASLNEC
jgi:hypothetical protein